MSKEEYVCRSVRHGVLVTVCQDEGTFTAYFSNAPGVFEELHSVKAIRNQPSAAAALAAGIDFVDAHQWQDIATLTIFTLRVRHWWKGDWGYSVACGGSMQNKSGFATREEAELACRQCAADEAQRLENEMAKYRMA